MGTNVRESDPMKKIIPKPGDLGVLAVQSLLHSRLYALQGAFASIRG
jgi:hypothetical protein